MRDAVIFDIDGTLLDTVDLHADSFVKAFAHFGVEVEYQAVREQIGKGTDNLLPVFLSDAQVERDGEALSEWRLEYYSREGLPRVKVFPKVRELFQALRDRGATIALATSAEGEVMRAYEKILPMDLVAEQTTSDDAEKSKPDPDIFEAALERLGNPEPSRVIVVGDTPYDAEAAGKAGLACVGVRCGGFPDDWLRQAGCVAIYDDPAELLARLEESPLAAATGAAR
jgi:HAD superfamily hydrolase (TIGR01509 family)